VTALAPQHSTPHVALREAPLLGKRAIVTGGTRGIGRAIATTYAAAGATVCAVASSMRPELDELEAELQGFTPGSFVAAADVASGDAVTALFADLAERWGPGEQPAGGAVVDVLVNNAGVVSHRMLDDLDPTEWDRVLNTNLGGLYRMCRSATPLMERGGSIVNIVSAVANVGMVGRTHYTASKAGMVGFTRSLCKELGPRGIRVNAIAPGLVETDQMAGLTDEQRARYSKLAALEALGQPLDIARAAVFFAAEYSGFVTGAVLVVDGGI
jgi:3-oxoacyl-[acyl-carrier protein] reductase